MPANDATPVRGFWAGIGVVRGEDGRRRCGWCTGAADYTAYQGTCGARACRFVGPTTAYAAMQSLGLVNDHLRGCFARPACEDDRARMP